MQITSNYIQLDNGWGFLEFEYNSIIKPISEYSFLRIKNNYNGVLSYLSYHPINHTKIKTFSNNVLDNSALQIDNYKWIHFDIDRPIRFFEIMNQSLGFQSVYHDFENRVTDFNVTYHTAKVHILRGYTFDEQDGFVLRISYVDNSGNQVYVANSVYLKDSPLKYHTKIFRIGDSFYDRYFEVKIPSVESLKVIDSNLSEQLKLEDSKFYNPIRGIGNFPNLTDVRINLLLYNVYQTEIDSQGQLTLLAPEPLISDNNGIVPIQIQKDDVFAGISATIQESRNGDYFEFFPSYQGEFIEDYLLSEGGMDYGQFMVFHDITIIEQAIIDGKYSESVTQNLTLIQEDNFDMAYVFRPIILDPRTLTFTIEYVVRIYDKTNNSNIIRKAILTYKDAQKYGRNLRKLDVDSIRPIKVVNKIVNNQIVDLANNNSVIQNSIKNHIYQNNSVINSEFLLPINTNLINISSENIFVEKEYTESDEFVEKFTKIKSNNSEQIYGQKLHGLTLTNFDQFLFFTIYIKSANNYNRYNFISNELVKYYIVFEKESGEKIKVERYIPPYNSGISTIQGEIMFRTAESISNEIKDSNKYYIIVENYNKRVIDINNYSNSLDFSTVIYEGLINKIK